jgi:hypothetical protein
VRAAPDGLGLSGEIHDVAVVLDRGIPTYAGEMPPRAVEEMLLEALVGAEMIEEDFHILFIRPLLIHVRPQLDCSDGVSQRLQFDIAVAARAA